MAGQLTVDTLRASTGVLATQNGMTGIAKAWVTFNGGAGNTAGVINGSFNVSSITVNGTGNYTINFTTTMPNTTYTVLGTGSWGPNSLGAVMKIDASQTTSSVGVYTVYQNGNIYNIPAVGVAILGS
jgi:hypothetical protein